MINSIIDFIKSINSDLARWEPGVKPWFRGESGDARPLCPKIASFDHYEENYLLQSFRRKAGALSNVPPREHTDMWLFLAQHYGVPTRLLDWTEGALMALYFAINEGKANPRVYMLNPRSLNNHAGAQTYDLNYPLSWVKIGALYVALSWENRDLDGIKLNLEKQVRQNLQDEDPDQIERAVEAIRNMSLKIPLAFPATYQDQRMIAQRSCFTIHGGDLRPIQEILSESNIDLNECLFEYKIDIQAKTPMLQELSVLGISAATIFPDLDHLAKDLKSDVEGL